MEDVGIWGQGEEDMGIWGGDAWEYGVGTHRAMEQWGVGIYGTMGLERLMGVWERGVGIQGWGHRVGTRGVGETWGHMGSGVGDVGIWGGDTLENRVRGTWGYTVMGWGHMGSGVWGMWGYGVGTRWKTG